jgi:acetylglutamate kinase
MISPDERAAVLTEALPYIRRFTGQVVVVKYGGNALDGGSDLAKFAEDIVLMHTVGIRPVVVHGGGPQITDLLKRLGVATEFRNGLRVTDAETMVAARMVLIGQVNPTIVAAINAHGSVAVGVSGEDGGLLRAEALDPQLGFVGKVKEVRPLLLHRLLDDGFVPVVATVGVGDDGQPYNINADSVAAAVAGALNAAKVVYLTDIEGIRRNVDDPASLIRELTLDELNGLIADGTVSGGMIPKVQSCIDAVSQGVERAHILDGRRSHALLLELFSDGGIGTMVTRS